MNYIGFNTKLFVSKNEYNAKVEFKRIFLIRKKDDNCIRVFDQMANAFGAGFAIDFQLQKRPLRFSRNYYDEALTLSAHSKEKRFRGCRNNLRSDLPVSAGAETPLQRRG